MIPIGDSLRSRTTPWVTWVLILVNFIVFFYELTLIGQPAGPPFDRSVSELDRWTVEWGTVPCRLADQCVGVQGGVIEQLRRSPTEVINLVTSQFIHGGWAHILGNMLFLFVFGDNVEDALGHLRYLLFYVIGGIIAGLAQIFADPTSIVPSVGASGAIAAVLGAYLVTYPRASVQVVIPIIIIPWFTRVPAILMMAVWFVTQLVSVGSVTNATGGAGGVAYWAHIGGFIAGMVLVLVFRTHRRSYDMNDRYQRYRWQMHE